jgi:hypothetical protein
MTASIHPERLRISHLVSEKLAEGQKSGTKNGRNPKPAVPPWLFQNEYFTALK